ncbi:transglycosylase SLT domain-containing protein [candidate division WOR-3 bacterium]|nr:transglycosylase SLT domain-containing protein [candidate division WOR-3 bacterium]
MNKNSSDYDTFISDASRAYNVDSELIRAIIGAESGFGPIAVSPKGAMGLMQLMPATAKSLGVKDLTDPRENIMMGTKYFAAQLKAFGGDIDLALAAYNAGPGNVKKYKGIPPFKETQDYVSRVKKSYEESKVLTGTKKPKESDWYNRLMQPVKVSPTEELGWYDQMMVKPKAAVEKPDISWRGALEEKLKPSPITETVAHLGWGLASWIPSKLSGLGQIGFQKLNNAIFGSEAKNIKRTPEERELFRKGVYSPKKIREMAEQSESLWQMLPAPETDEAKFVLEKVGVGLDKVLTPFRIADEYYTKKGYPNLGYALRFAGEMIFFKAAHGFGVRSTAKIKKLGKKIRKKAPVAEAEKTLGEVFDEMGIPKEEAIIPTEIPKGITKSQKMRAHKIAKEKGFTEVERRDLAEQVTGKRSMMDMDRGSAKEFIEELKKGKEEVADAERIGREAREAGEEARIKREEERQIRLRDVETDRLEAIKKEAKEEVVEVKKPIDTGESLAEEFDLRYIGEAEGLENYGMKVPDGETTITTKGVSREALIKKIAKTKKAFEEKIEKPSEIEPPSEAVKTLISDDIRTAEDMGLYADIREMIGKKRKVGEIIKEFKQKAYYEEDLKDFGYTEKDIRSSIDAIKAEMGDKKAIERVRKMLKEEEREVEKIPETEEIEPLIDIERVHPETGRPAGVKEDLISIPKEVDEVRMKWEQAQMPITKEDGSIAKSKFVAMKRAKELGKTGDLVKNPKGEGWLVKRTKAQREAEVKAEQREWEEVLKEEEIGEIGKEGLGERVDVDIDHLWGEKGAITFHRKTVKKIKDLVKTGAYTRNRVIKELRERGATDEDILRVFPDASVRILNEGIESKWWKKGQDSLELLPRRKLPSGLRAPAITRGEAHTIATMKDMPARLTAEHLSWENTIRTFEKLPAEIKETFYRSIKEGESLAFDRLHDLLKRSKKIRHSVSYTSHKRIGVHSNAVQPDGIAVLAQQGITKIPKLKSKELKAYEDLRAIYDELYIAVNRSRKAAGEKPFPPIGNYATWIQDMTYLDKIEGIGLFSNWRTIESKLAEIKKVPSFRFAKFRAGPEMPRKLNLNPFTVLDTYSKIAANYIEMAPRLAKLNELLTEKFGMAQNAPHAYNFIRHWLNYQAGKIPAWDIAHPTTRWAMRTLNSNIVYSLLAFNIRSALIQPAALASSYTILGEYYTGVGLSHAMSPAKWKMAGKKSKIINTRTPEVAIYEAMEAGGKFPSMFKKKVAGVGMIPLTVLDSVAARITLLGAYAKGKQRLKLSEEAAWNYADDVVIRTQASAARSDVAPIQRTQLGKTVTCLQTFVINHWGFLTKDVLGIKNANINNATIVKRVIRFILATTAVNAFYEEGLKLNSPNPTPIRAYREIFEETGDPKKAFARGVKEIAEYIPLWGGRLRYGSEIGGPVLSELLKLIEDGNIDALIKLIGIPGSNQFFKMVRAHERRGTDIDIALGRYVEPRKRGITAPMGGRKTDLLAPIGED